MDSSDAFSGLTSVLKVSLVLCRMSESPSGTREGLQDNATGKKGKFITDSSQGPLPHPTQWCRSESPEPKLLQIYRVSTRRWFKQIGYKFAKQFHWSKLSCRRDFPGGFLPVPNFLIGKQWSVLSES